MYAKRGSYEIQSTYSEDGDDYMIPVNRRGGYDYPFYNESIRETLSSVGKDSFEKTKANIEKISSELLQEELDPWFDYRSIYAHKDHTDMITFVITDSYGTNDGEYEKRFHGCNEIVGIAIANQWEELLHVGINIEGYLPNEFVKAADNVAMSDNNANHKRVRVSADICDGNYKLYDMTYFTQ